MSSTHSAPVEGISGPAVGHRGGSSRPRSDTRALRRALDILYLGAAFLGAGFLVLICVLMLAQALLREFGMLVRGADDITAWSCAAAAFLPLAQTFKRGEMVRVGLWLDKLGPTARWLAELFSLTIAAAFIGYLTWWLGNQVYESWMFGDLAQGLLRIPIWIPQSSLAAGAAILLIALVDELVAVARGRIPSYVLAEQARRASGDFSAEV